MKLQKIENYSHFLATSMKMSLIFVWGHHVLGDISFVLERMKFTTEELNYSIIKFTTQKFPKVKNPSPYIKQILDNIHSHYLNISISSNFQPMRQYDNILFFFFFWKRPFQSSCAKVLYFILPKSYYSMLK